MSLKHIQHAVTELHVNVLLSGKQSVSTTYQGRGNTIYFLQAKSVLQPFVEV
jgi:hypothetical protein